MEIPRKDYVIAAAIFRSEIYCQDTREGISAIARVARSFAWHFQKDNSFDIARFYEACGLNKDGYPEGFGFVTYW